MKKTNQLNPLDIFLKTVQEWKEEKKKWVRLSSYATYAQLVNRHVVPYFSSRIEKLKVNSSNALLTSVFCEKEIQRFTDHFLKERHLSLQTTKDILLTLKMILRFGEKKGAWPHIEFTVHYKNENESMRKKIYNPKVLSMEEEGRLMKYLAGNFSFRNLGLLIALNTGVRIGELCALRWKDVDIAGGVICICKAIKRIYYSAPDEYVYVLEEGEPKSQSSVREIPISQQLMKILKPLQKIMRPEYYIVSNAETPLDPRTYRAHFARTLNKLQIPRIRFHAIRHSFATRCIESGCDYKTVSSILGHASLATTMDMYVHPGNEQKRKCIEKMLRSIR